MAHSVAPFSLLIKFISINNPETSGQKLAHPLTINFALPLKQLAVINTIAAY
jgi:hypothetical protein